MLEPCMVGVETLEQHQKTGRLRLFAAKMGTWPGGQVVPSTLLCNISSWATRWFLAFLPTLLTCS